MALPNSSARLKQLRQEFLQVPMVAGGILLALEILPKTSASKSMRLLFTLAWFGSALMLLWHMTKPREEYMRKVYEWRYQDCNPTLETAWKLYLRSLTRVINLVAFLGMGLVGCVTLDTLDLWFPPLATFSGVYVFGKWICIFGLMLCPIFFSSLFNEVFQRRSLLTESAEASNFQVRTMTDLEIAATQKERAPVEVVRNREFRVGGMEWSWEDFYKNAMVFGQSGTGKTICVLNAVIDALLASTRDDEYPCGGLILDPKGDFASKIQIVCRKHGRRRDLMVLDPLDPAESIRWNPLDTDDDELEIAARFAAVMESVGMKSGDNSFWVDSARKFMRHAIALIRLTNEEDEPPSFAQVAELATNLDRVIDRVELLPDADDDYRAVTCTDFFAHEWAKMDGETRSGIQAQLTNMIDPFLMEPYRSFFSGRSTARIAEMVKEGNILYVHMPIAEKEAMSRMICTFVKLEYYREVLKRPDKPRPTFFLCDEFQSFFTTTQGKGDSDFFERSRQSNHANIVATQNLPALFKQAPKEDPVKNLLGNCAVKLFLRNTDAQTNQWAAELFGQKIVIMSGAQYGASQKRGVGLGSNQSASSQYDFDVRPEEFTRLLVPARGSADYCEAILHLASRSSVMKQKTKWKVHELKA